jgi:VWFA-related protein
MLTEERLGLILVAAVLFCAATPAQQNAQSPQPENGRIYLDVVVSEKSGPPVAGLQQQDFTLLDNNAPQPIGSFQAYTAREAPLKFILVEDAVNTAPERVAYERNQIDRFLRSEGGRLAFPVALTVFTEKGLSIAGNFTTDGNVLAAALDKQDTGPRAIGRSAGFYGAADRWQISVNALRQLVAAEAARHRRKIIVWISPGWPLLSTPETDMMGTKQQTHLFDSIVTMSTQLREARVTIDNVNPLGSDESISNDTYYMNFVKPVTKPNQVYVGNMALQVLAVQTGGVVLNLNNDTAALLQQCMSDAAPYYELSFDPPKSAKKDEYHRLEIKIAKPGLTARTRQGYYAQPPA